MVPTKIIPGEVRVSSIWTVLDTPDVKIFEIDMDTKYAELLAVGRGDNNEVRVMLMGSEHALHLDESRRGNATTVVFSDPGFTDYDPWWDCVAEGTARYSMRVVLYREREGANEGNVVEAETITVADRSSDQEHGAVEPGASC